MNETNINDIDVSECNAYKDKHCKNETSIMFTEYNLCSNFPDCYFKQFKRLEQQNEAYQLSENEAKEIIAELKHKNKRLQEENKELRQIRKNSPDIQEPYIYLYRQIKKQYYNLEKENEELLVLSNKGGALLIAESTKNKKYKLALEEIREKAQKHIKAEQICFADEIINLINEVLNDRD